MSKPTFVDLQGFIVGRHFVAKEVAVLRDGFILSHYIFAHPVPWSSLTKAERHQASWLMTHKHRLQWEDGFVPYSTAKHLITKALKGAAEEEETPSVVYVKGREKREWLFDLLEDDARDDIYIDTIDTHYEDIGALETLDITHTLHCGHHVTNHCALQNVFKLYNWWFNHQQ